MQYCRLNDPISSSSQIKSSVVGGTSVGGRKTVGRWLKDRKEKKKEEVRAQNAQLHAAISVAGVAAAIAAIAAATAASSGAGKDEQMAKTDMAVASAATLVAAQCVEAAEAMGAERELLASVVSSAVNVQSPGDIMTLTAAAATGKQVTDWEFHHSSSDKVAVMLYFGFFIKKTFAVFCSSAWRCHVEGEGIERGVEHRVRDPRGQGDGST